jgi:hypothetical protein
MSIPADKCNVAWFKLAECVSRGGKERALGVYRLLAHSLDDKGVASQLEGDILFAFGDKVMAKNRYDRAIAWYKHDKRFREMAAVSEKMHAICPADRVYLEQLIDIYVQLSANPKVSLYLSKLISLCVLENDYAGAVELLERYETVMDVNVLTAVRQQFVSEVLKCGQEISDELILPQIHKIIDVLLISEGDMRLQQFLTVIQELSEEYYVQACEYLENAK